MNSNVTYTYTCAVLESREGESER